MYLLDSQQDGLARNCLNSLGSASLHQKKLLNFFIGEDHPRAIKQSLFVLALVLHVKGALWLMQPVPPTTLAKPLMMEVALMPAPPQKAAPAPPKAAPPPKKVVTPPKKPKPVVHKQVALPKPKPSDLYVPAPAKTESVPDTSLATTHATAATKSTAQAAPQETVTEARPADYGSNPKPDYPSVARSNGWEGKVVLRVRVSADGDSESVSVLRSSGHDVLDEAAVEAVEQWKFTPGKRGDQAVATTVNVPIIFTLNN